MARGDVGDDHTADQDLDVTQDVDFQALITETIEATTRRMQRRSGASDDQATASSQAAATSSDHPRRRVAGGLLVARPKVLTRIVLLGVLCLLAALAVLAAFTAQAVGSLVDALRDEHRSRGQLVIDEPLPPDRELLDEQRFAEWLARRPDRASAFHLRRAELLLEAGRPREAAAAFREASLTSRTGLGVDDRLAHAQALARADQPAAAIRLLESLLETSLSQDQRSAVLGRLGRLYAARALSSPP